MSWLKSFSISDSFFVWSQQTEFLQPGLHEGGSFGLFRRLPIPPAPRSIAHSCSGVKTLMPFTPYLAMTNLGQDTCPPTYRNSAFQIQGLGRSKWEPAVQHHLQVKICEARR